MAKGKLIGDFTATTTSVTYLPGPAGSVLVQANYEGTAAGFGTFGGTGTFVGGASGTFSYIGAAFPESGVGVTGQGTGGYESNGVHRWKTTCLLHLSDGGAIWSEGEIDLAARSFNGKNYEWT